MARPKHDNPALFVGSELESATGLSKRNIQLLRDRMLGPFEARDAGVDGKYTEDAMAELAIIAAINSAGFPLLLSVPISRCFLEDKERHAIGRLGWTDHLALKHPHNTDGMGWFEAHSRMRSENTEYRSGCVLDDDALILVADKTYVAEGRLEKPRIRTAVPAGVDGFGPLPLGRLVGMEKSKNADFIPVYQEHVFDGGENDAPLYLRYQRAVKEALGLVRVNASLAIRRAFDNVHDFRNQKGGPFFS